MHARQVGDLDHWQIKLLSRSGSTLGSLRSSAQDHDENPQWSPEGRQIIFERDSAGEPVGEAVGLYVADAKTGRAQKLNSDIERGSASWRPR